MRYVATYLLASYGGKVNPTASDLEKILSSVGIECDLAKVKKVIDELNGKSIDELIAQGQGKLASVHSGGAVAAPTAASGGAAAPAAEEKKEEPAESESDDDMGFGLFD